MTIFEAFLLGLVQGLTEFLPVSSSGHLAILQTYMGLEEGALAFTVMLHAGSLIAVFLAYRKSVLAIIKALVDMIVDLFKEKSLMIRKDKYRMYVVLLFIASIPAGIAGILFGDAIEKIFSSVIVIACMLLATGVLLIIGEKIGKNNIKPIDRLGFKNARIVGVFQALALIPGLSRSGTTMVGGLLRGMKKEDAVEFSFLLSLPAVLGATLLKLKDIVGLSGGAVSAGAMAIGFFTAVIVGYLAIRLLVLVVKKDRLKYFSYYCWAVGIAVLVKEIFFK